MRHLLPLAASAAALILGAPGAFAQTGALDKAVGGYTFDDAAKPADAVITLPDSRGARMVRSVRITSARTPRPRSRRSRKAKLIGSWRRGGCDLPDAVARLRAKPWREKAGSRSSCGFGSDGNSGSSMLSPAGR